MIQKKIQELFEQCDGIVILAGAGMGVDAGIPDFRGDNGLWTEDKMNFIKYATADAFEFDAVDAWNFYITRLLNYSRVEPHRGYYDLLNLDKDMFVVTSNVDGHFQRAGFDPERILEIHGDLRTVQHKFRCALKQKGQESFPMPEFKDTLKTIADVPKCPHCGEILRPQVMMFNDFSFRFDKVDIQQANYWKWAEGKKNILGIEIGAGTAIPSIRMFGNERTNTLIRINPHDTEINRQQDISIAETAVNGIALLFKMLYNVEEKI